MPNQNQPPQPAFYTASHYPSSKLSSDLSARIATHPHIRKMIQWVMAGRSSRDIARNFSNPYKWPEHTFTSVGFEQYRKYRIEPTIAMAIKGAEEADVARTRLDVDDAQQELYGWIREGIISHRKAAPIQLQYIDHGIRMLEATHYRQMEVDGYRQGSQNGYGGVGVKVDLAMCVGMMKAPGVATFSLMEAGAETENSKEGEMEMLGGGGDGAAEEEFDGGNEEDEDSGVVGVEEEKAAEAANEPAVATERKRGLRKKVKKKVRKVKS
jgi:hypothetical protein